MKLNILLIGLFAVGFVQADVYKYINKQGKTAYSDRPVAGAEKVIVPPVMTYEAPVITVAPTEIIEQNKSPFEQHIPYQFLEITAPRAEGTVRSNEGILNVSYELQPALQKGDSVNLLLDGIKRQGLNVQGVEKGAHVVSVEVVNENGDIQIRSLDVTFYLQRSSRL